MQSAKQRLSAHYSVLLASVLLASELLASVIINHNTKKKTASVQLLYVCVHFGMMHYGCFVSTNDFSALSA